MRATVKLAQGPNLADRVQFLSLMVKAIVVDSLISADPELQREVLRNLAETFLAEDDAKRDDDAREEPRLTLASSKRPPPAIGTKQCDPRCSGGDDRATSSSKVRLSLAGDRNGLRLPAASQLARNRNLRLTDTASNVVTGRHGTRPDPRQPCG
jgi:hypothetical protein